MTYAPTSWPTAIRIEPLRTRNAKMLPNAYRRANGYFRIEKLYHAMQDVIEACILARFKVNDFNLMATRLVRALGMYNYAMRITCEVTVLIIFPASAPPEAIFLGLDCFERQCDYCDKRWLQALKGSTLLVPLMVRVDDVASNADIILLWKAISDDDPHLALQACQQVFSTKIVTTSNTRAQLFHMDISIASYRHMLILNERKRT